MREVCEREATAQFQRLGPKRIAQAAIDGRSVRLPTRSFHGVRSQRTGRVGIADFHLQRSVPNSEAVRQPVGCPLCRVPRKPDNARLAMTVAARATNVPEHDADRRIRIASFHS